MADLLPVEDLVARILDTVEPLPAFPQPLMEALGLALAEDVVAHRVVPHMHLLGKSIELLVTVPGQPERSVVNIPAWDYNWQEVYELKEPLPLPKGTKLRVRATYDNSAANPNNPNSPPQTVSYGEQTTSERGFVFVGVSTASTARRLFTFTLPAAKK